MDEWKPVVPLLRGAVFTAAVLRLAGGCAAAVLGLLAFTGCGNPTTESVPLLENVTVIDGTGAPAQAGMSVVVAGSDLEPHGGSLHQELELLVEAGLSPAEAIAAATSETTAFLGLTDELGAVEAGKRADLVLLDSDPLADITNTRRIAAVVVGGVFLNRTDLNLALSRNPGE